jgi:hypothetical protein
MEDKSTATLVSTEPHRIRNRVKLCPYSLPQTERRDICHVQDSQGIKSPGHITPSQHLFWNCAGYNRQQCTAGVNRPSLHIGNHAGMDYRGNGSDGGRISRWNMNRPGDCLQAGFSFPSSQNGRIIRLWHLALCGKASRRSLIPAPHFTESPDPAMLARIGRGGVEILLVAEICVGYHFRPLSHPPRTRSDALFDYHTLARLNRVRPGADRCCTPMLRRAKSPAPA